MGRIALVLVVVLFAAVWAVADPDSGVRSWIALDRERSAAEARLAELRRGAVVPGESDPDDPKTVEQLRKLGYVQ